MLKNFFNQKSQTRTNLPQVNTQTRLPTPKTLITIDCFTVPAEQVADLFDDWNYLTSKISQFDNVNSINLYQNLSHKNNWILQIEWKSGHEFKQALSDPDFKYFQDFLQQWNIAISPEQQQKYRTFPGFNFDQTISKHKRPWRISTNFIIIIAFVFGIAAALIILVLR